MYKPRLMPQGYKNPQGLLMQGWGIFEGGAKRPIAIVDTRKEAWEIVRMSGTDCTEFDAGRAAAMEDTGVPEDRTDDFLEGFLDGLNLMRDNIRRRNDVQ